MPNSSLIILREDILLMIFTVVCFFISTKIYNNIISFKKHYIKSQLDEINMKKNCSTGRNPNSKSNCDQGSAESAVDDDSIAER